MAIGVALSLSAAVCVCAQEAQKSEKTLDAAPATTAVTSDKDRDVAVAREFPDGYLAQRLGATQHCAKAIGAEIQDQYNFPLGTVKELLVNLHEGKIYCALVRPGSENFVVAVPGRCFYPADNKKVQLDLTKRTLKKAPHFNPADWEYVELRQSIGDSFAYFSQRPLWDGRTGPGPINKAREFTGMTVRNKQNEALGAVQDLMIDLPTARIVFVVVSFDGSEKSNYAVPPEALSLTPDNKALLLDASKAQIRESARQDDYFWTLMSDKAWAANVYRSYGVEPDFDQSAAKADATREQVRARVENLPPNKAAGKSDAEISRMIMIVMVQGELEESFNHKNIKLTTVNGYVTLSGRVDNVSQREKLGKAAERVVGRGYVDNQIETK